MGDLVKYIYICNAVSEEMCNYQRSGVAGNKFSLNMAKAFDACCGGDLIFVSVAGVKQEVYDKFGGEIWEGKKLHLARRGRRFVLGDFKQQKKILAILKRVCSEYPNEKITVIIENSSFSVATACAIAKKKWGISCYSITIDTPFTQAFKTTGFHGRINKWMFMQGRRALKSFDGLVSFTPDVMKELNINIPFCQLAIGYDAEKEPQCVMDITSEKSSVFAGTLIYYNGIRELLGAFALLGEDYKLHIYGYGPMVDEVKAETQKHSNIVFHGRFDPSQTDEILSRYQLLINSRLIDPSIENFTFPSKMIDYILTGKSVLSSNFKTLPEEYKDFVYILEGVQEQAIADAVRRIFDEDIESRKQRGQLGIRYIKENQTYEKIAKKIFDFVN